jgi:hypothetical protein
MPPDTVTSDTALIGLIMPLMVFSMSLNDRARFS